MSGVWPPVWWMTGAGAGTWLMLSVASGGRADPEVLLGMVGPLVSVDASWIVMGRAFASGPQRLMGVMIQLLFLKMMLFGAYVTVMLRVVNLRPVPFVISFSGYFIALYAMEAVFLQRLLAQGAQPPRG